MNYQITDTPESNLDVLTRDTDGKVLVAVTKIQHTPGPWHIDGYNMAAIIRDKGKRQFETLAVCGGDNWMDNAARIVACVNACEGINPDAVPEMLEALKWVLQCCDPDGDGNQPIQYKDAVHACGRVRAAISKAEGRS